MRIIVVSHTYIVDLNCEKLRTLANLEPGIELTIVVPKRWRPGGVQNKVIEPSFRQEDNFRVIPVDNFSENNQGLLTFRSAIVSLLREFRPQIIQVEQGVKSLAYAQLITLNHLLRLKAKNVFFTWWNLPYQSKFPLSLLENYNLRNTHGAIAGNQDGVKILRAHGYQEPLKVIPQLGVDPSLFTPCVQSDLKASLGITSSEFVVGFVGRFVEEKGILALIAALATLKDLSWKLLLLGRGPLEEVIRQQVTGFQERVLIVESVPHDEVSRYINLMNVLVLPSQTTDKFKTLSSVGWKEQFGHVLIEAMACGVPVIGSDSGEIPNVIEQAGLIFPEGDVSALARCLQRVMTETSFSEHLGKLGYERAILKYTNHALAQQQLAFYRELLS